MSVRAPPREPGEAILDQLFAREFERLHTFAQPLDIVVGMVPELSAQTAQRFDNFASERAGRSLRHRQRIAAERSAPRDADPQRKQNQVYVEAVAVLQRDQRLGDPRPLVEGKRETPERLVLRRFSSSSIAEADSESATSVAERSHAFATI